MRESDGLLLIIAVLLLVIGGITGSIYNTLFKIADRLQEKEATSIQK